MVFRANSKYFLHGIEVTYGHLKTMNVKEGDSVNKGDVIALMGSTGMATGPNLAFSISVNGEYINPLAE